MTTYKITFQIRNGKIAFTDIPTFDALLAYCYFKEYHDQPIQELSYDKLIDFTPMPIEKQNGVFLASQMFWQDKENTVEYNSIWRKKWDNKHDHLSDFGKKKRQVQIARGEYKSYEVPIVVKLIDEVWFYFVSDKVEEVKQLLSHLKGIGKKNSTGFGLIESYTIVEVEDDSVNFENDVLRPIPIEHLTDTQKQTAFKEAYCGYQPPYWDSRNMTLCAVPK